MPRGPVVDQWPDNHAHEIVPGVWLGDFESAMDVQSCSTRRISILLCADKRAGAAVSAERGRSKSGNATSQRAAESGLIKKTESLVLPLDSMSKTPITTKIVIQFEPPTHAVERWTTLRLNRRAARCWRLRCRMW